MTRTLEIRPDINEGIDRKVLAQLRARQKRAGADQILTYFATEAARLLK